MTQRKVKIGMMSFAHMHAASYAHSIAARAGYRDGRHRRPRSRRGPRRWPRSFETQAFQSYEALLSAPGLDAVVICSENVRHRELAEMAAAAGKHVLCEKPLATTVADGEAMIAACQRARACS